MAAAARAAPVGPAARADRQQCRWNHRLASTEGCRREWQEEEEEREGEEWTGSGRDGHSNTFQNIRKSVAILIGIAFPSLRLIKIK